MAWVAQAQSEFEKPKFTIQDPLLLYEGSISERYYQED